LFERRGRDVEIEREHPFLLGRLEQGAEREHELLLRQVLERIFDVADGIPRWMLPGAWSARAACPSVAAADLDAWRVAALEVTSVIEGACGREALHSIMDRIASP
jgi:uncharacterized protein YbaR (Trm112 family)